MLGSIMLVVFSVSIAAVACEMGLRIFIDPVDYLKPDLVTDPVLGVKIVPNSSYHDAWGFRNKKVPDTVDIVAIGDSMTYGYQALARDAWPAVLGRKTGKSVYNMAVGGYGPFQCYYLLTHQASLLKPKVALVGIYLGAYMSRAYDMGYNNQYWKEFLAGGEGKIEAVSGNPVAINGGNNGFVIDFLMHHSIIFRMALESVLGTGMRLARKIFHDVNLGFINFQGNDADDIVYVSSHNENIAISEGYCFNSVNLEDEKIVKGIELTKLILLRMDKFCSQHGIKFISVIIPTKETVYSQKLNNYVVYDRLKQTVQFESLVKKELEDSLSVNGIAFIDSTPCLIEKLKSVNPYPFDMENHPNRYGYEAIASCVASGMNAK